MNRKELSKYNSAIGFLLNKTANDEIKLGGKEIGGLQ